MATAKHPLTVEILGAIKVAVKQFGKYSFVDKGPTEVMDTEPLMATFEALPEAEQIRVCQELRENEYGDTFVEHMLADYEGIL